MCDALYWSHTEVYTLLLFCEFHCFFSLNKDRLEWKTLKLEFELLNSVKKWKSYTRLALISQFYLLKID